MVTHKDKFRLTGEWLQSNLQNLRDKDDNPVFKKVLLGFDSNKVKTYGGKAIAVTYVTGTKEYNETFGRHNRPQYIESVVGFVIKDHTEAKYQEAVQIMDLLHEEFETNNDWFELRDPTDNTKIVRATFITDSVLTLQPTGKQLDIIGVFTLRHHIYK